MKVTPVTNDAPFPVDATYVSQGGPLLIQFAGSAWAKAPGIISVNLTLDGATVTTTKVTTNEANSHRALVPVAVLTCSVKAGSHKFAVAAGDNNTNLDGADFFTITVFEFFSLCEGGQDSSVGDPGIPTGFTAVTAKHSGKVLDVAGGSKDDDASIIQYGPRAAAENELFQFIPLGDGYYRIVAKHSGKVLDVTAGAGTMSNGAAIRQWGWVNTDNQKFRVEPVGGGYYRIVAKHSLRVLTVEHQSKDDSAKVIQWEWADIDNQKWKLS